MRQDDRESKFQTVNERMVIRRREIEELTEVDRSIMAERLLKDLTAEEVGDLIAYC